MAYDRDEFVRFLTDYYNFCNRVFWFLTVVEAPSGGWPEINKETLAALNKNDTVIDLLRHLPYVNQEGKHQDPFILDDTPLVNYRMEELRKAIREGEFTDIAMPREPVDPPLPPSCAAIAIASNRRGYEVILDTEDGYIYWGDPIGTHDEKAPALNSTLEERFGDDPANQWRLNGFNVYEPADFFELCKERFRELQWIGLGPDYLSVQRGNMGWEYESEPDEDWSDPEDDCSHNKLARKMKKAGWPGDGEGREWDVEKFVRLWNQGNDEKE